MAISLSNLPTALEIAQPPDATWRFAPERIVDAMSHLGVTLHVRVGYNRSRRWSGLCAAPDANGVVSIRVCAYLKPEAASKTLWHELTHAAQHSQGRWVRTGSSLTARRRLDPQSYAQLPNEAEAKGNERLHDELYPLTERC